MQEGIAMNPNYVHTITVYNCLRAADSKKGADEWRRTVLHGCFYKASTAVSQNGTDAMQTNVYTVRIPRSDRYLPYEEWKDREGDGLFTISKGDVIVHGECSDLITGKPPYTASQILLKNKPDAFMVTSFSDNTGHRMGKHYRAGG